MQFEKSGVPSRDTDEHAERPVGRIEGMDPNRMDVDGRRPDYSLVSTHWCHFKRGDIYVITGFAWCGDTDKWHILHKEIGPSSVVYSRSFNNFFGDCARGFKRFTKSA